MAILAYSSDPYRTDTLALCGAVDFVSDARQERLDLVFERYAIARQLLGSCQYFGGGGAGLAGHAADLHDAGRDFPRAGCGLGDIACDFLRGGALLSDGF